MGAIDRAFGAGGGVTEGPLTDFQVVVARLFFSLPESDGFLLAGGAALAAQHLTARPTRDLDLFTRDGGPSVSVARDAFEAAVRARGWDVRRVRDGDTFCRLVISGDEELLVDLALDSPPSLPASLSPLGPTFALEELAGRKLIALFDRAEARDFADVFVLAQRYGIELLLRRAGEIDPGFDLTVLASMLGSLARFADAELPVRDDETAELRAFFQRWQAQLRASEAADDPP